MTTKQFILTQLKSAGDSVFERAAVMPADKLEWKPLDNGRSALDLAQECAYCPNWAIGLLQNRTFEGINMDEEMEVYNKARANWTTLDDCRTAFAKNYEALEKVISDFPDEDLGQEVELPWGKFTFASVMAIPTWNCQYHVGQINYIQTLYGDRSM